jgi:hypothetical protein
VLTQSYDKVGVSRTTKRGVCLYSEVATCSRIVVERRRLRPVREIFHINQMSMGEEVGSKRLHRRARGMYTCKRQHGSVECMYAVAAL